MGRLFDIELTDEHVGVLEKARDVFEVCGEAPTLRRLSTVCGVPIKRLFELFPQKPAKKVAYLAGLPKPRGCV
jgi:tRNA 2-thiouridine synthesizing protein E